MIYALVALILLFLIAEAVYQRCRVSDLEEKLDALSSGHTMVAEDFYKHRDETTFCVRCRHFFRKNPDMKPVEHWHRENVGRLTGRMQNFRGADEWFCLEHHPG